MCDGDAQVCFFTYKCGGGGTCALSAFKDKLLILKSLLFFPPLYLQALPQWVRMINDTEMDSGEKLQWECKATGRPRPTYRWLRNGLPLTSQVPSTPHNCPCLFWVHLETSESLLWKRHVHSISSIFGFKISIFSRVYVCVFSSFFRAELKSWMESWPFTKCSRWTLRCTSVLLRTNMEPSTPVLSSRF